MSGCCRFIDRKATCSPVIVGVGVVGPDVLDGGLELGTIHQVPSAHGLSDDKVLVQRLLGRSWMGQN